MPLGKSVGVLLPTVIMLGNDKAVAQPTFGLFDMRYRRVKTQGATYFFTVVTFRRRKILCEPENRELLRTTFRMMKSHHPFTIDAFVLLPENLHCIWTLPPGDADYSMRWNPVKHGLAARICDWPYSSFHRFVQLGIYPLDWTGTPECCVDFSDDGYGE